MTISSREYRALNEISQEADDFLWELIRNRRDALLIASDPTQVLDSPNIRPLWVIYRQELRDLPDSVDDPRLIVWPIAPAIDPAERAIIKANREAIRIKLNAAIAANISASAIITTIGTKADSYAKNPATNLSTTQITSVLKDICSGIVITCQAILLAQQQLVGIEYLALDQLDTTTGT